MQMILKIITVFLENHNYLFNVVNRLFIIVLLCFLENERGFCTCRNAFRDGGLIVFSVVYSRVLGIKKRIVAVFILQMIGA